MTQVMRDRLAQDDRRRQGGAEAVTTSIRQALQNSVLAAWMPVAFARELSAYQIQRDRRVLEIRIVTDGPASESVALYDDIVVRAQEFQRARPFSAADTLEAAWSIWRNVAVRHDPELAMAAISDWIDLQVDYDRRYPGLPQRLMPADLYLSRLHTYGGKIGWWK